MTATVVELATGRVEGRAHDGVVAFRGVPYAAADRFARPRPSPAWTGVLDATGSGPMAPQRNDAMDEVLGVAGHPQSESCLSASVWTPACDDGRRPVLVWIHGGAFLTGSAATPWYDGSVLARSHDVVVIGLQYRLGVLGFCLDPSVADGEANLGLVDCIAGLRWVRDHAHLFGGDPGNVTVFGESAGGAAVLCLAAMPEAAGLFHRAIAQSPSLTQVRTPERAEQAAEAFAAALPRGRWHRADVAEILDAQDAVLHTVGRAGLITAASPTWAVASLPRHPVTAFAHGVARRIPVLIGTTAEEMALFQAFDAASRPGTLGEVADRWTHRFGADALAVVHRYAGLVADPTPARLGEALATDEAFTVPTLDAADALVAGGGRVWTYLFAWRSPLLGACHGIELPFVFGTLHAPGVALFVGAGPELPALSEAVRVRWAVFARDGACGWAPFTRDQPTLVIGGPEPHEVAHHPMRDRIEVWDAVPRTWARSR